MSKSRWRSAEAWSTEARCTTWVICCSCIRSATPGQLVYREVQIIPCPDIGPDDMQIRGQAVTQLMSEIAGGAGNQDARCHDSCSLMVAGARAGSSAGSGRRAQYWDRVRPLTRCHTP